MSTADDTFSRQSYAARDFAGRLVDDSRHSPTENSSSHRAVRHSGDAATEKRSEVRTPGLVPYENEIDSFR